MIPHFIVFGGVQGAMTSAAFLAWFAIMFTGRFPDSLLRFSIGVHRWNARYNSYQSLLTGQFPPLGIEPEETYPVRLSVAEQISGRNRLTTFFRVFMVIPHFIVLFVLAIAWVVVVFISWFAALFTGSVPGGLHNFIAGYWRWNTRVNAYFLLLVDDYPPFSLD